MSRFDVVTKAGVTVRSYDDEIALALHYARIQGPGTTVVRDDGVLMATITDGITVRRGARSPLLS